MKSAPLFLMLAGCLALLTGCASLEPPTGDASYALAAERGHGLGRIAAESLPAGAGSAFRPLPMAAFAMDARLTLVHHAQHSLDLQYYLLQDDEAGRALLRGLRDAAQRGVRVRLLVDDLYTASSAHLLMALRAHPNVEVRVFNPFPAGRGALLTRFAASLLDFARVNRRMHNKLFMADGAFAIAGGRNVANEYFRHSTEANFLDFDVLLLGEVVPQLASVFDRYWNSRHAYPLDALEPAPFDQADLPAAFERLTAAAETAFPPPDGDSSDPLGYAPLSAELARAQPMRHLSIGTVAARADDPAKVSGQTHRNDSVTAHFVAALQSARQHVLLVSPYFIPGDVGLEVLRELRGRGVRVEVVTNALASNDEPFASAAYARYREALMAMGVELYEISSRQMKTDRMLRDALGRSTGRSHAKLTVIDDTKVFVGSMNLDMRSARANTELGLLIDSPQLAAQSTGMLQMARARGSYRLRLADGRIRWTAVAEDGVEVVYDDEPEVDLLMRLKVLLIAPLIPEAML
ncbi:phospholipase D-like domain-containing protein [Variovorax fucosicus]|uniref:phospholipase D-like domain-containing protein n=1 Tax=Variovorax fucosicus TaxID=3053517 RepID=UPI002575F26B|nr:phospholipase D family protein [Variovorax sp. J22G47]MDM0055097.1 phospholipase D family protein [Variovorax sp. J22G47]